MVKCRLCLGLHTLPGVYVFCLTLLTIMLCIHIRTYIRRIRQQLFTQDCRVCGLWVLPSSGWAGPVVAGLAVCLLIYRMLIRHHVCLGFRLAPTTPCLLFCRGHRAVPPRSTHLPEQHAHAHVPAACAKPMLASGACLRNASLLSRVILHAIYNLIST